MNGTYYVTMGDRGRLVVPVELRERAGLTPGTPVIIVDSDSGVILMTRDQARSHVIRQLAGSDVVGELLADRRRSAAEDDAA